MRALPQDPKPNFRCFPRNSFHSAHQVGFTPFDIFGSDPTREMNPLVLTAEVLAIDPLRDAMMCYFADAYC